MRLRLTLGLCALALAVVLVACGGGGEEKGTPSGSQQQATPTAGKTVAAGQTSTATAKPSSSGAASLGDVPVYPGANKVADYSGTSPIPLPSGEGADTAQYQNNKWALYETGDSASKVADYYKNTMPDKGWDEQGWFDTPGQAGASFAVGSYTRDNGNTAAWILTTGSGGKTEIVIGTGTK